MAEKIKPGQRFTRLLVLSKNSDIKATSWNCVCDCGVNVIVQASNLRRNHTRSCGCYNKEVASKTHKDHGLSLSAEYVIWKNMISRCNNKFNKNYKHYGGRGISVCNRWLNSLDDFIKDVGKRPSKKLTLDRIDNNGNYEPSNCRWATMKEQANNKRNTRFFKFKDRKLTIDELAKETGVNKKLIVGRVDRGWSLDDIILIPKYMKRSEWMNK